MFLAEAVGLPARAAADAIPGARYITLDGQDHGVLNQPDSLRSALTEFSLPT